MYNPYSLEEKTILITGASSGIGRGIAIECSKMGASVILVGRNVEQLEVTFHALHGSNHKKFITDISNEEDIQKLAENSPVIDGFVNSAGIPQLIPVSHINRDNLSQIMNVNTIGPILLTSSLLKKKKIARNASIVYIASIAGVHIAELGGSSYAATKGAISGFIKGAALDLAPKQIRVNSICPGLVKTNILNMAENMFSEQEIQENISKYPLKKFGTVEDIALGTVYLLSDASKWVTGINLTIDGGYTIF